MRRVLAYVTAPPARRHTASGWLFWPLWLVTSGGRLAWRAFRVIGLPFLLVYGLGVLLTLSAAGHELCRVRLYVTQPATDPMEQFDLFIVNSQIEAFREVQQHQCGFALDRRRAQE